MNPVTPSLRRSDRLRRPTAKAIGSSPGSSPGKAAHVGRSIKSRLFSAPGDQTDSDSTLRHTSSSQSSGSGTEDTVGDATECMALGASFPPPIYAAYRGLAPMLRYSDKDLMKQVSLLSFFPTTNPPSFVPTLTHSNHAPHRTFPL
jgi:hypothetical protein